MTKEHGNDDVDWRLQATTTLAKPFASPWTDQTYEVGSRVTACSTMKFRGNKTLTISLPNAVAMCLNISYRAHGDSNKLLSESGVQRSLKKAVNFINDAQAIDCMENLITSIVFAFTALEAFANETIPDDYIYEFERRDKRCTESYSKDQIERYISLDDKISCVLPSILKVKSPKGTRVWQEYSKLKKIRDRIIHMK